MKKYLTCIYACCLMLAACEKNEWGKDLETAIAAAVIQAPGNDVSIDLDPMSNAVVAFEWQAATTVNYTIPFYKVLFDKESGDFSKPVFTGVPASMGTKNTLVLSHRELNKIASKAGIKALEKGKLKWTVVASNGVISETAAQSGLIELQRPAGFAENPADAYFMGSATEAGTDLSKAIKFKKLSDGVFELYTSLTTGAYTIVDKTSGTPLSFVLDGPLIKEGAEGNSPAATPTAYRINLDFNTAVATLTEIQEVGLWFAGYNRITNVLSYDKNGIWKAADIAIAWSQQSWGKDERYKFRVVEKDMNGTVTNVYWASSTKDNNRPTGSTAASYFYLKSNDASQWDYTWKFEKETAKADVLVKFQTADTYTHQVIYK